MSTYPDPEKTLDPATDLAAYIKRTFDKDLTDAEKIAEVRRVIAPLVHDQVGRSFDSVADIVAAGAGVNTSWTDGDGDSGMLDFEEDGSLLVFGPSGEIAEDGPYLVTEWYDREDAGA